LERERNKSKRIDAKGGPIIAVEMKKYKEKKQGVQWREGVDVLV